MIGPLLRMIWTLLGVILRRFRLAVEFALWGISIGILSGCLLLAVACGLVILLHAGDFQSVGLVWNFYVVIPLLYMATVAGGIGGAIGGVSRSRLAGAVAGAMGAGHYTLLLLLGPHPPPEVSLRLVIVLASAVGAGIGNAIGGAGRYGFAGALAGAMLAVAMAGICILVSHGDQMPRRLYWIEIFMMASTAGAGAIAGWFGGRGVRPFGKSPPWWW